MDIENNQQPNLISEQDLSLIKIKLGKSHRKESDWQLMKDILRSHDIVIMEPRKKDKALPVIDHLLVEDGAFVAFTSIDECKEHIRWLNEQDGAIGRMFQVGVMPFEMAIDIADRNHMDLYIDPAVGVNVTFMAYLPSTGQIKAMRLARA